MSPSHTVIGALVSELTKDLDLAEEELGEYTRLAMLSGLDHEQELRLAKLIGRTNAISVVLARLGADRYQSRKDIVLLGLQGGKEGTGKPVGKLTLVSKG